MDTGFPKRSGSIKMLERQSVRFEAIALSELLAQALGDRILYE
jgi:hypothetical protein